MEVSPDNYQTIRRNRYKLFAFWSVVSLRDQLPTTQCHNCQRFGHKARNCKHELNGESAKRCRKCGGNHDHGSCSSPTSCCNCVHYNLLASKRSWNQVDINHCADDKNCPMLIKAMNNACSHINYGY